MSLMNCRLEVETKGKDERYIAEFNKQFRIYKKEFAKINRLFSMRCTLIDPPTNYNVSFTNFIAMILCKNFIPWEPNELKENFIHYGEHIVPNETKTGLKCREKILEDLGALHLPESYFSFHDALMQWKVHFNLTKDQIVEFENNAVLKNAHNVQSEKMLSQISLLRTMIEQIGFKPKDPSGNSIDVPAEHEEKLKPLFKACDSCIPEKKDKEKTEEKQDSRSPMQRLYDELKNLLLRYSKIHMDIKNIDINDKKEVLEELGLDGDLPSYIQAQIKKIEEMIVKWKASFRGEQPIQYFNSAEFYLQHVLHLFKEYLAISSNLYGFRRVLLLKVRKISRKKDFVAHSKFVLKELAAVQEAVVNIYSKTLKIPEKILKFDEEHGPVEWDESYEALMEKLSI